MDQHNLASARNTLSAIVERVQNMHTRETITKHGRPAAVVISPDELASLVTTVELLSIEGFLERLEQARKDVEDGNYKSIEEVAQDLQRRLNF